MLFSPDEIVKGRADRKKIHFIFSSSPSLPPSSGKHHGRQKYVNNPATPIVLILQLIFKLANAVVTEIGSLNYHTYDVIKDHPLVSCDEVCLKEYDKECHNKIKTDPRLIITNLNVSFFDKDNGSSWYALVQWNPLEFPKPWLGHCINYRGPGDASEVKGYFLSQNTTSVNVTSRPQWKRKVVFVTIFGLSMFGNDIEKIAMNEYLMAGPTAAVVSKQSATNISHRSCECLGRVRRIEVNDTDYPNVSCDQVCLPEYLKECLKKTKTDPRLIITNLKVSFLDNDDGSSWYTLVQWSPLEFPKPWLGYCVNYNWIDDTEVKGYFLSQYTTSVNITSLQGREDKVVVVTVFGLSEFGNDIEEVKMIKYLMAGPSPRPSKTDTHPSKAGSSRTVTFVAIAVGSVVGIILVACILRYFYYGKKGNTPLPQDFQYHAFIIYNHEDRHWMKKQLLPLLEEKHHLTCCIHYKDFIPGKPIRDNMADSVYTSYKVIALFSNNFLESNCCMYELDVAVNRLVQKRDNSLAIIRIDGVQWERLPAELRGRCCIDYHYPQERPFWRKRLLKFLNLPEECRTQSTPKEPAKGNNNENNSENRRIELNRLQSTESNVSEISFL